MEQAHIVATRDVQKMGGWSALILATTFIVGFVIFASVLMPAGYFDAATDAAARVAVLADNYVLVLALYIISYVVFGIFLVVLALAMYQRLKTLRPGLAGVAAVFGAMWATVVIGSGMIANVGITKVVELSATDPAQAGSLWQAIESIQLGLGGGNEIVGGVWVLLISWIALATKNLPRLLGYLGLLIAVAGILTVMPGLQDLGIVFGLGLIVWFVWLGVVLLRSTTSDSATA